MTRRATCSAIRGYTFIGAACVLVVGMPIWLACIVFVSPAFVLIPAIAVWLIASVGVFELLF